MEVGRQRMPGARGSLIVLADRAVGDPRAHLGGRAPSSASWMADRYILLRSYPSATRRIWRTSRYPSSNRKGHARTIAGAENPIERPAETPPAGQPASRAGHARPVRVKVATLPASRHRPRGAAWMSLTGDLSSRTTASIQYIPGSGHDTLRHPSASVVSDISPSLSRYRLPPGTTETFTLGAGLPSSTSWKHGRRTGDQVVRMRDRRELEPLPGDLQRFGAWACRR